ncbi:hypothetical protein Tco_1243607 [Tanacetum coccineum]
MYVAFMHTSGYSVSVISDTPYRASGQKLQIETFKRSIWRIHYSEYGIEHRVHQYGVPYNKINTTYPYYWIRRIDCTMGKQTIEEYMAQIQDDAGLGIVRRKIGGNYEGLAAITTQLSSLGREIKKFGMSRSTFMRVLVVELCKRILILKDCLRRRMVKDAEGDGREIFYGVVLSNRPLNHNRRLDIEPNTTLGIYLKEENKMGHQEKRSNLEELMDKYMEETTKRSTIQSGRFIQNGNGPVSITTDTSGQIKVLPPRTAEEIVARERERKARTTLLMALPEDHLAQLKIHGAGVSTEDANQKFLRSLPSAWSQVSLIMRTKPGWTCLCFDDLSIISRVFESDIKGSTASSSKSQNVAFVSENTSSTNEVSTAYCVPNSSGQNSKFKGTQDNRRRDAWNSGNKDGSRTGQKEDSKALVTIDGEGVDWTNHSEDDDYALMAFATASVLDTENVNLGMIHRAIKNKASHVNSGCSQTMTGTRPSC